MKNSQKVAGIALLFIIAVVIFIVAGGSSDNDSREKNKTLMAAETGAKQYVCSMHPQVIRDVPGDCPICGMFLIELVSGDGNKFDSSLIDIVKPVNAITLGSVKCVNPVRDTVPVTIEANGIINYDPRSIRTISAKFGGYIEKTFVKYQFQYIPEGRKIYEIYSPNIYTERWNYVQLIQAYPDRDDLTREALEWFDLLGLSKGQVDSLKYAKKPDYHLAVYSRFGGYAVSRDFDPETFFSKGFKAGEESSLPASGNGGIGLNEGITVETGTSLFKLIDITALRIDLKVKTEDAPLLKAGQEVILTDAADHGRQLSARLGQIEPLTSGQFQTAKVYIKDKERIMLPGRQINAQIMTGTYPGLWVPGTAVADLGQRHSVFVKEGEKFVATEVWTGVRTGGRIQILYGIDENTTIAEKALLLIDSDGFISAR